MLGERPEEVTTSTAQGQVIGKRHFGRKALPPGGGGGKRRCTSSCSTRLLMWKARIVLDEHGRVTVRSSAQRFVVLVPAGRRRASGRIEIRPRVGDEHSHQPGPDAVLRPAAGGRASATSSPGCSRCAIPRRNRWPRNSHGRQGTSPAYDKSGKIVAAGEQNLQLTAGEAHVVSVPMQARVDVSETLLGSERERDRCQGPAPCHAKRDRSLPGARLSGDAGAARQTLAVSRRTAGRRCSGSRRDAAST